MGASVTLTALLVVFGLCSTDAAARIHARTEAAVSSDFIASSCRATTYRRLCVESLSPYASAVRDSPLQLARAALAVSLSGARSAAAAVSKLADDGSLPPREAAAAAARDCMTTAEDSVEELQRSLGAMGKGEKDEGGGGVLGLRMDDIQTWVSAALTDEDTCIDGFAGGGAVKVAVKKQIVNVAQLTSNALALINALNLA
ncbi:hypothetical protein Cni_G14389 [Canna indica]|uniref:Pectinesterase inhibitor domain-containing protein n=1 Tax=Canna indica TaxID=4628 RepID=A0AAQ3KE51_9LILI|nr:hypothetical protein Cni_G14389 [Canna indica]